MYWKVENQRNEGTLWIWNINYENKADGRDKKNTTLKHVL